MEPTNDEHGVRAGDAPSSRTQRRSGCTVCFLPWCVVYAHVRAHEPVGGIRCRCESSVDTMISATSAPSADDDSARSAIREALVTEDMDMASRTLVFSIDHTICWLIYLVPPVEEPAD